MPPALLVLYEVETAAEGDQSKGGPGAGVQLCSLGLPVLVGAHKLC